MAWCRQATSHYLSQCWPRSLSPYDVTRPQWVKRWHAAPYANIEFVIVFTHLHNPFYFVNFLITKLNHYSTHAVRNYFLYDTVRETVYIDVYIRLMRLNYIADSSRNDIDLRLVLLKPRSLISPFSKDIFDFAKDYFDHFRISCMSPQFVY